jgi:hypothetical protein
MSITLDLKRSGAGLPWLAILLCLLLGVMANTVILAIKSKKKSTADEQDERR